MYVLWHESLIWGPRLAVVLIFVGALFVVAQKRRPATVLQLLGALLVLAGVVVGLHPTHLERGRIEPAWVLELSRDLGGIGIVVFAVAYAWCGFSRGRHN